MLGTFVLIEQQNQPEILIVVTKLPQKLLKLRMELNPRITIIKYAVTFEINLIQPPNPKRLQSIYTLKTKDLEDIS